jgi:uncharacterized protein
VKVLALRRYPVKSMGGESLDLVVVDPRGLAGDRWYAVTDRDDKLASGKDSRRFRRRDAVFDWSAATTADGVVVSGPGGSWPAGSPSLDRALTEAMGDVVRLQAEADAAVQHQDGSQVSIVGTASLAWCREHLGVDADPRRLRVNVLVETAEPFVEETWVGSEVSLASVRFRLVERIQRCRMVDLAQDGVPTTERFLKALGGDRELCLGVYADVVEPGEIAVGDEVVVASA